MLEVYGKDSLGELFLILDDEAVVLVCPMCYMSVLWIFQDLVGF